MLSFLSFIIIQSKMFNTFWSVNVCIFGCHRFLSFYTPSFNGCFFLLFFFFFMVWLRSFSALSQYVSALDAMKRCKKKENSLITYVNCHFEWLFIFIFLLINVLISFEASNTNCDVDDIEDIGDGHCDTIVVFVLPLFWHGIFDHVFCILSSSMNPLACLLIFYDLSVTITLLAFTLCPSVFFFFYPSVSL